MKKLSILVMGIFGCFLFGMNAEAESVEEGIVHSAPEQIGFSDSLLASKTRKGDSSSSIDGEKCPKYKGDIRILYESLSIGFIIQGERIV